MLLLTACGGGGSTTNERSLETENDSSRVERDNKVEQCFIEFDEIVLEDCEAEYTRDSEIDSCIESYEEEIVDTCLLAEDEEYDEQKDELVEGSDDDIIGDSDWWDWLGEQEEESLLPDEERDSNETNLTLPIGTIAQAKAEPYFQYAWHLDSSNSILNKKGYQIDENADINVTGAWAMTMGAGVKVAVIDDGADVNHEDLKANMHLAYNADMGGTDIRKKESHGNTCAGFIVAPINGKGIVGVAPESKMLSIKLEDSSDAYTIRAFEYAKKHGAKVISCSWGSYNVSDAVVSELKSLYDAGITVLFASGNEGTSHDTLDVNDESEVEWVIGVGASGENNDVTSYSNYGKNIDIIAPGGDSQDSIGLLGLDDMGDSGYFEQKNLVNNNYSFTNGTSFSTPITAGVVAMMYAVNPNITAKQVKDILTSTASKVGGDMSSSYDDKGFDEKRAYGKINAGKAVMEAKRL